MGGGEDLGGVGGRVGGFGNVLGGDVVRMKVRWMRILRKVTFEVFLKGGDEMVV